MNTAATILQSELIGLNAKVTKSSNPSSVGISGKIIDETRNTLVIKQKDSNKTIQKETTTFQFTLPSGTVVEVEGNALIGKPEDRLKKRPRRQW